MSLDFCETDHWKMLANAKRYLLAADVLKRSEEYSISKMLFTPTLHLTAHGIELLLKANLVGAGFKLNEVKKYGHNISALWAHERNQIMKDKALLQAENVWQQVQADGEWPDQFSENPKELLEVYIASISDLHSGSSEYALRYVAKPGTEGPRPHLLVDTFLFVSDFCLRQPDALVRSD